MKNSFEIEIFKDVDYKTLNKFKLFIPIIWFQYLIFDNISALRFVSFDIFFQRGIFRLISINSLDKIFYNGESLIFLKILLILLLIFNVYTKNRLMFSIFLGLIYFYELVKLGFGGHIDHRIITLYLFSIIFHFSQSSNIQAKLIPPTLFFFLQYTFTGLARLINGFPAMLFDETFSKWLIQRSLRPNPYNLELGSYVADNISNEFLNLLFLFVTILETISIVLLFLKRKYRNILVIALIFFHIGIFFTMGIVFAENVLILFLYFERRKVEK